MHLSGREGSWSFWRGAASRRNSLLLWHPSPSADPAPDLHSLRLCNPDDFLHFFTTCATLLSSSPHHSSPSSRSADQRNILLPRLRRLPWTRPGRRILEKCQTRILRVILDLHPKEPEDPFSRSPESEENPPPFFHLLPNPKIDLGFLWIIAIFYRLPLDARRPAGCLSDLPRSAVRQWSRVSNEKIGLAGGSSSCADLDPSESAKIRHASTLSGLMQIWPSCINIII